MNSINARQQILGFTLLELLLVVVISAILMSVAAPYYSEYIKRGDSNAGFNKILRTTQLARSVAINEGTFVSVCPTEDDLATLPGTITCSAKGDYFIAFRDLNQDGVLNDEDAETLAEAVVRFSNFNGEGQSRTNRGGDQAITFQPDGNTFQSAEQGAVYFCSHTLDEQIQQRVVVSNTGRARVGDQLEDSDCA